MIADKPEHPYLGLKNWEGDFVNENTADEMMTIQAMDVKKSYSGWPASMQE